MTHVPKLSLNIEQRVRIASIVSQQEVKPSDLRFHDELGLVLDPTAEELAEIEGEKVVHLINAQEVTGYTWDPTKLEGSLKDLELSTRQFNRIKTILENWPKFTRADIRWAGPVLDQFGI